MPWKPGHPCRHPGCNTRVESGESYCDDHKKQRETAYDNRRGTAHQRGYDTRWRRLRTWFLNQHPLCAVCLGDGKLTPASVVDHVIPHKGDKKLFYDISNLQSLCIPCHSTKTAKEDGGFGNARG